MYIRSQTVIVFNHFIDNSHNISNIVLMFDSVSSSNHSSANDKRYSIEFLFLSDNRN